MTFISITYILFLLFLSILSLNALETITDPKGLKAILKRHENVLLFFQKGDKDFGWTSILEEAHKSTFSVAAVAVVQCKADKKLCKKMNLNIDFELVFYRKGEKAFAYNRAKSVKSLIRFLNNPSVDVPWDEDPTAKALTFITDTQQFQKLVTSDKRPILLMFYAPWCGHCKRLKPEFIAAAEEVKSEYIFAALDANDPKLSPIAERFNITGFPTLFYISRGMVKHKYAGKHTKEALVSFMNNPSEPTPEAKEEGSEIKNWSEEDTNVTFLTIENVNETLSGTENAILMFYTTWCSACKSIKPMYSAAAAALKAEKFPFMLAAIDVTNAKDVIKAYEIQHFPTLKYYKLGQYQFDPDARTTDGLIAFAKNPQRPVPVKAWHEEETDVVHLNPENFKTSLKPKKHSLVIFYAPWCQHCKKAKPEFTAAAAKLASNPKVLMGAVNCDEHRSLCTQHKVEGYPTFIYFNYGKLTDLTYNLENDEDDFVAFLTDPVNPPLAGAQKHWKKIEHAEHLQILTDQTFKEVFHDQSLIGMLVMFYAPWCGHCVKMKPDFAKLAKSVSDKKFPVAIAAVDATKERGLGEDFKIQSFPSLYYVRSDSKNEQYQGERTSDSMLAFIKRKVEEAETIKLEAERREQERLRKIAEEKERARLKVEQEAREKERMKKETEERLKREEEEKERKRQEESERLKREAEERERIQKEKAERLRKEEEEKERIRKEEERERLKKEEEKERIRKEEEEKERERLQKEEEERERIRKEEEERIRKEEEEKERERLQKEEEERERIRKEEEERERIRKEEEEKERERLQKEEERERIRVEEEEKERLQKEEEKELIRKEEEENERIRKEEEEEQSRVVEAEDVSPSEISEENGEKPTEESEMPLKTTSKEEL